MKIFGYPVFGFYLPFIGKRRIYLNRDLSFVDTGKFDLCDERGPYYTEPMVIEWLGFGVAFGYTVVFDSMTHKPVEVCENVP